MKLSEFDAAQKLLIERAVARFKRLVRINPQYDLKAGISASWIANHLMGKGLSANDIEAMVRLPETMVTAHKANFDTLKKAFTYGDAALMECQLKATGEKVAVICAVVFDGTAYNMTPFAMFFNGNPYELLNPPDPDGGFQTEQPLSDGFCRPGEPDSTEE